MKKKIKEFSDLYSQLIVLAISIIIYTFMISYFAIEGYKRIIEEYSVLVALLNTLLVIISSIYLSLFFQISHILIKEIKEKKAHAKAKAKAAKTDLNSQRHDQQ